MNPSDVLVAEDPNWVKVQELANAASKGNGNIEAMVARLYELGDAWRHYTDPFGKEKIHTYLYVFLATKPTAGAGMTEAQIELVKKRLESDLARPEDGVAEAADELLKLLRESKQKTGRESEPKPEPERPSDYVSNRHIIEQPPEQPSAPPRRPAGTTRARRLRQLDSHVEQVEAQVAVGAAPDEALAEAKATRKKVLLGELSAKAACEQVGIIEPSFSITFYPARLDKGATALRKKLTPDQLAELRRHLEP